MTLRWRRALRLVSVGVAVAGCASCVSECSTLEATGPLGGYAANGCIASGSVQDFGVLVRIMRTGWSDDLLDEVRFGLARPLVVGRRASARATVGTTADSSADFGGGIADYVITSVAQTGRTTKDVRIDFEVACPKLKTDTYGEGAFRVKASVPIFNFD